MQTIDVIIPTGKNIEESNFSICYTIRSILSQNLQPLNIFVVENNENVNSEVVIKDKFGIKVKVLKGDDKSPNISYARNLGVKAGSGDILLFMDDDVILGRNNYFSDIASIMQNNDFCCGALRYWSPIDWYEYLSMDYQMNHNLQILKHKSFLPCSVDRLTGKKNHNEFSFIGNFGAIRRTIFNEIGGFDEKYKGWLHQDTDLMMRLCHSNYAYEILAYSNIHCYHLSHPADKERFRQENQKRYIDKQNELNIRFNCSCFFGQFGDGTLDVISPHPI